MFQPSAAERLDQEVRVVGVVLVDIGEAGHRLALGEQLPIREPRVAEDGAAVAERAGDLSRFSEREELCVDDGLGPVVQLPAAR